MHKLNQYIRPAVIFNPNNKDHRAYFSEFLKTSSWKNCPVQFYISDESLDLIYFIQKSMITYYIEQEFVVKKPRIVRKTAQKSTVKLKKMS
jgi:hypothetical protein